MSAGTWRRVARFEVLEERCIVRLIRLVGLGEQQRELPPPDEVPTRRHARASTICAAQQPLYLRRLLAHTPSPLRHHILYLSLPPRISPRIINPTSSSPRHPPPHPQQHPPLCFDLARTYARLLLQPSRAISAPPHLASPPPRPHPQSATPSTSLPPPPPTHPLIHPLPRIDAHRQLRRRVIESRIHPSYRCTVAALVAIYGVRLLKRSLSNAIFRSSSPHSPIFNLKKTSQKKPKKSQERSRIWTGSTQIHKSVSTVSTFHGNDARAQGRGPR